MADEQPQGNGPEQQQIQLMLDDREVQAVYANSYRIFEMMDEVFIELGYNMPHPHQQPPPAGQANQPQVLLKMTHRVIMNRAVMKRLASTLSQMVKRYEQQFGEIPIQPTPPQRR
jgi:DNA-directed RNA polymerase subunit L